MERDALLHKLNWFYSLEVNQVEMYLKQSNETDDPHLSRALKKFAEIEQGHMENIREAIENMGETATISGEFLGKLTGSAAGLLASWSSWDKALQFNIALEKKAIEDYKNLANTVDQPEIGELLLNNMIDEELHAAWMSDFLKRH